MKTAHLTLVPGRSLQTFVWKRFTRAGRAADSCSALEGEQENTPSIENVKQFLKAKAERHSIWWKIKVMHIVLGEELACGLRKGKVEELDGWSRVGK